MKKIDLYQCDICGTQFSDKKLCEKCERGHVTDILIRKSRYLPITQSWWSMDESGMPTTVTLVGLNGRCYTYKR
jgi:hypothetical protein